MSCRDDSMRVTVPVLSDPSDRSAPPALFQFALSAKVIYDQAQRPACIQLNLGVEGWSSPNPPAHLNDIPIKINIPYGTDVAFARPPRADRRPSSSSLPVNSPVRHFPSLTPPSLPPRMSLTPAQALSLVHMCSAPTPSTSSLASAPLSLPPLPGFTPSQLLAQLQTLHKMKAEESIPTTASEPTQSPPVDSATSPSVQQTVRTTPSPVVDVILLEDEKKDVKDVTERLSCSPEDKKLELDALPGQLHKLKDSVAFIRRKILQHSLSADNREPAHIVCRLCGDSVGFSCQAMVHHLYGHMNNDLYRCNLCSYTSAYAVMIIRHCKKSHRDAVTNSYIDCRWKYDQELSETAFKCFFNFAKYA